MLGKIEDGEEKGVTEDEMAEWHHQLDGHELKQVLGAGDRQGNLGYCSFMGLQRIMTE